MRNAALALGLVMLVPLVTHAQIAPQWSLASRAWDGLNTLAEEASQLGCTIEARSRIDFSQLAAKDSVWLLHPTRPLRASDWMRFVENGGALVVLDDFGEAAGLFERFGLSRTAVIANRVFDGNPALPVADPTGSGRLGGKLPLVSNHPAALDGKAAATFRFSSRSGLIYELHFGDGTAVLGSDSSLLINNMLELQGNLDWARALIRTTCSERSGKALLLVDDFTDQGELSMPSSPSLPLGGRIRQAAAALNSRAASLALRALPPLLSDPWVASGLALCLVLFGLSGMLNQFGRRTTFDTEFFRATHAKASVPTLLELMRDRLQDWWQSEGKTASAQVKRRAHDLHEQIERLDGAKTLDAATLQIVFEKYRSLTGRPLEDV